MDFSLSEEQVLLQDSVARFVRDHCDVERHRNLVRDGQPFDHKVWQQFAELGWLSVPFEDEFGGFGGGSVDVMVVVEALAKGIVREPYLSTVVTCGAFLRRGGTPEQQSSYIENIIDGSKRWAFAFAEADSGYDIAAVATSAEADDDNYVLNGAKFAVVDGDSADFLIVSVRTSGADRNRGGISLFIVDASSAGVTRKSFTRVDGGRAANIEFKDCAVNAEQLLGTPGQAYFLMQDVIDESIVAMGAEALGIMQALLDATVEYTKTRKQFGQPIGKFQALQHRMADMYLKLEETRSLVLNAAIQIDAGSDEAASACAALKVKICEAGKFISQESIQLHGGIGMTDELVIGHHFKRLMVLSMLYGDEDYYLQRYIELSRAEAS
ncbi:MAG: alkylation response protein AidB-like acyl-CoA dehydrogenase [Halioglobus sp.]|jgi:alkylation response protein AidB-like acyl-CoA dehydrogenase